MITDKQKEYIESLLEGETNKKDEPSKYYEYHRRIRKRIDHMFANLLWLASYAPHYLTDEEFEIQEYGNVTHRRLKWLMQVLKEITPDSDPILVKARRKIQTTPFD